MVLSGSKKIIILGIVAFLAMSFWSLSSMSMDMNGRMINCPFMSSHLSLCQMTLAEHISQWQKSFTIIREKTLFLYAFLLLIALYVVGFTVTTKKYEKLKHQRFRIYFYRYKPELKLFNFLAIAFSDGLIHSKIYA